MAMELSVHRLINLVTKDLTSLLDFWKDRRYETDSTESFRHFMDYEEDIKSFLSKVDVQLEFWKRLKSLDDGDEDPSKKNNKSSTSPIDSGCQTETTTLVRNSKIRHTEDKTESRAGSITLTESNNSQQQDDLSENIAESICGSSKDVEKEITNPEIESEMTGIKIGGRFTEIYRSLQKKSNNVCQSVDKETATTSTSESGLELGDKNVVCYISNTQTVGSNDSQVIDLLADTPSSTIDLSEDVIIEIKKEPEEMMNSQTGCGLNRDFSPVPAKIFQVEDSGNGSSGDDLTNSPAKERNPRDDELGGSYIQEDNAEIVMNNLGIECMITIHENNIKTEFPPEGPRYSTIAFPELSLDTSATKSRKRSEIVIKDLASSNSETSIKTENPEGSYSSAIAFPELPLDMPAKRARRCVELPELARNRKDRELSPKVVLDESVRKIADKAVKYNEAIKIPPKVSGITDMDLECVKSEKPKKKMGILTPAQNLRAKHYAISIEKTVEKSRQFLLATQIGKHSSSKKRDKQRKKLKKKRRSSIELV